MEIISLLSFQFEFLLFLVSLLWPELPVQCWRAAVAVGLFVLSVISGAPFLTSVRSHITSHHLSDAFSDHPSQNDSACLLHLTPWPFLVLCLALSSCVHEADAIWYLLCLLSTTCKLLKVLVTAVPPVPRKVPGTKEALYYGCMKSTHTHTHTVLVSARFLVLQLNAIDWIIIKRRNVFLEARSPWAGESLLAAT